MPIMLNTILREAGLPLGEVRLLRHKDKRASKGRSPYLLWRDQRPLFEQYQSTQSFENRKKLTAPYWAVFIVSPNGETMFGGIYRIRYRGLLEFDMPSPHIEGGIEQAGSCDRYDLTLESDYQVSILEVAGTSATVEEIRAMEGRWQAKLQSREMGLNRNWAGGVAPG